jgi:hypothetical protein
MNSIQLTPTQSSLLDGGPKACMNFIHEYFPLKYDWIQLAEGATTKASTYIILGEQPFELGLSWIRVAVELYERMADNLSIDQKRSRLRLLLPAIALRVRAIVIWGAQNDDHLLNPEQVVTRFHSIIEITPAELREDIRFPRASSVRDALEIVKYIEPLLSVNALKNRFPEISEYCDAARIARQNARTGFF